MNVGKHPLGFLGKKIHCFPYLDLGFSTSLMDPYLFSSIFFHHIYKHNIRQFLKFAMS